MAKKVEALKEQARDKTPKELKERAQELIGEALDAAAARQDTSDNRHYAERLLFQLEPIVRQYAPPPERIMSILEDKGMLKPSTLRLESHAGPKLAKVSKDAYADKRGERLARRHHKGWTKVKY